MIFTLRYHQHLAAMHNVTLPNKICLCSHKLFSSTHSKVAILANGPRHIFKALLSNFIFDCSETLDLVLELSGFQRV